MASGEESLYNNPLVMGHLTVLKYLNAVDMFQKKRVNKSNFYKWNF